MKNNHYDVVVIGAGMGGLTTANYCARAGYKVLLLEKNPKLADCLARLSLATTCLITGPVR
jgi:Phytoene dehydrogenase and related proteins